jgi:low temperature requirement protein LtrA
VGRTVSFLELFYDLVYVVVVSQAAHHLADHVSLRAVGEFAVVFTLIWIGWINGSLYLELHGREDGRTRTVVFVQMGILVRWRCSLPSRPPAADVASPSPTPRSKHY